MSEVAIGALDMARAKQFAGCRHPVKLFETADGVTEIWHYGAQLREAPLEEPAGGHTLTGLVADQLRRWHGLDGEGLR